MGQEKKWVDAVKLTSVTQKDRDPVFANNVVTTDIFLGWQIINTNKEDLYYHKLGQMVTSTNQLITGSIWVYLNFNFIRI